MVTLGRDSLVATLRELCQADPKVVVAYLFGSRAAGTARADSDVDLGVLFRQQDDIRFPTPEIILAGEIERAVGVPADVVRLNVAPPDLMHRVLLAGCLVYDGDSSARIAFEVAARNAYFDILPHLRRYRRQQPELVTDEALVRKKLSLVEACLSDLRRLANPTRLETDIRERRFVEHTLQVAIQAALDVASHIVSDERLGEPATNRDLFGLLADNGWIDRDAVASLRAMTGFRNVLVHGYTQVDIAVLRDVLTNHLTDLEAFVATVRLRARDERLAGPTETP